MRIVALSDLHAFLPDIPSCDLLIVAGDICPDRIGAALAKRDPGEQKAWFDRVARPWFASTPAKHRIMTWGNHDWCGEAFNFPDDGPDRASTTELQILIDQQTSVPDGASAKPVTIWATPWSNTFMTWAFMKEPEEIAAVY